MYAISVEDVLEIIDDALMVFGESCKKVVYYIMEKNYGLKVEEIPRSIGLLHEALEEIFQKGHTVVENVIVKKTCERLGLEPIEGESFVECMTKLLERVYTRE